MKAIEYISSKIPDFLVSEIQIEKFLALRGVSPSAEFDSDDYDLMMHLELGLVDCYFYILRLPNSISQGGFSLSSVDKEVYMNAIKGILKKYGLEDELGMFETKPNITEAGEWY